jgi:hypothetical protein
MWQESKGYVNAHGIDTDNFGNPVGPGGWGLYQITSASSNITQLPNFITRYDAMTNFDSATQVACKILKEGYANNGNQTGAQGLLNAIAYYNGGGNATISNTSGYLQKIFPKQFSTLRQGGFGSGNYAVTGLSWCNIPHTITPKQWPYKVFGPCGLRLSQAGITDSNQLYQLPSGFQISIAYLKGLLNKYNNLNNFCIRSTKDVVEDIENNNKKQLKEQNERINTLLYNEKN